MANGSINAGDGNRALGRPQAAVPPGVRGSVTADGRRGSGRHLERAGPLVSAVVATQNCGHFVTRAVLSALEQTYHNLEVIVVDDGSTDGTAGQLAPYRGRVRYVRQEGRGLSAAWNTGIRQARGDWVAFLDAHDAWHPRKTEVQLLAVAGMGDVALVGSPGSFTPPAQLPLGPAVRRLEVRRLLVSAPISPSSALVRRSCIEDVGFFDEGLKGVEDRDMWLLLAARYRAILVDSPCWTRGGDGEPPGRRAALTYQNHRLVLRRFFAEHPAAACDRGQAWGYLYLDAAVSHIDEGDRRAAIRFMARSLACWPLPLGDPRGREPLWRWKFLLRESLRALVPGPPAPRPSVIGGGG
jgi:glycosyltransferase involved in cell wall biosynthesis